jgi:hypothetical protein
MERLIQATSTNLHFRGELLPLYHGSGSDGVDGDGGAIRVTSMAIHLPISVGTLRFMFFSLDDSLFATLWVVSYT